MVVLVFIYKTFIKKDKANSSKPSNPVYIDGFDPVWYLANYPDVARSVGSNHQAAYQHYLNFGKAEGRKPYGSSAPNPAQTTASTSPSSGKMKLIVCTDFGGAENDNPQWISMLRRFDRDLKMYVCTNSEVVSGFSKLQNFVKNDMKQNTPVYLGAQSGFSGNASPATQQIIALLRALPSGEVVQFLCGGSSHTMNEVALHASDVLSKLEVYWVANWNRSHAYGGDGNEMWSALKHKPFHKFYRDEQAFRGMMRGGDTAARAELHTWLTNSNIASVYNRYPINEASYDFKCGDGAIDFFSRGEFIEVFVRDSASGTNYYVADGNSVENRLAKDFKHISNVIKNTVNQTKL